VSGALATVHENPGEIVSQLTFTEVVLQFLRDLLYIKLKSPHNG
jgi:hypothetical protein